MSEVRYVLIHARAWDYCDVCGKYFVDFEVVTQARLRNGYIVDFHKKCTLQAGVKIQKLLEES